MINNAQQILHGNLVLPNTEFYVMLRCRNARRTEAVTGMEFLGVSSVDGFVPFVGTSFCFLLVKIRSETQGGIL